MPKKIISLIGMTGCGKSTVGRALSVKLGLEFIDLDDYIVSKTGKTPREIFDEAGEEHFRRLESQSLLEVISNIGGNGGLVLSCGGGIVTREANISQLRDKTLVLWIKRPAEEVAKSPEVFMRPPINGSMDNYMKLYSVREPLYTSCAHHVLEHREVKSTVDEILRILDNR